jgi:hypothetical protein
VKKPSATRISDPKDSMRLRQLGGSHLDRKESVILSRPDGRQDRAAPSQAPYKHVWRLAAVTVLIVIGVIGIFAIVFPTQFKHQLEISLIRQPTPYTQLYFTDPATLPKELKPGVVNKFAFTIINNEGHSEIYRYVVTMTRATSQTVVSTGSLTVGDNRQIMHTVGVEPRSKNSQYLIKVTLKGTVDSIQFYGSTS